MTSLRTRTFGSRADLNAALAARLHGALSARGASAVMLSGGTTPMSAYEALARERLSHDDRLHVLFSDERYVPASTAGSNYYQARALLNALALPQESLLRVRTELPLEAAAADYENQLLQLLSAGIPIGLGLLGLGVDGHTASLFSVQDLEHARGRYALEVQRPDGRGAVSVTPELIGRVREPLFVVAGPEKRAAINALVRQDPSLVAWRAVQGCDNVEVWTAPE
ncbi:MAG TPA: 6-phosphogluconolactonase [Steroidobacteraceae bacterium]|nr:6-phosphogluconolactonase [Steroidobacteraceae bacterium]